MDKNLNGNDLEESKKKDGRLLKPNGNDGESMKSAAEEEDNSISSTSSGSKNSNKSENSISTSKDSSHCKTSDSNSSTSNGSSGNFLTRKSNNSSVVEKIIGRGHSSPSVSCSDAHNARKRSRSEGSTLAHLTGRSQSNDGITGSTTPSKRQAVADSNIQTNGSKGPTELVSTNAPANITNGSGAATCSEFAKDVEILGARFSSVVEPMSDTNDTVCLMDMDLTRVRFVFLSGQEIIANFAEFNKTFPRVKAASDFRIIVQFNAHGPYFNQVQQWNVFIRTARTITMTGQAHEEDIHFILDRCHQLGVLQVLRITLTGRRRGAQPTSVYGDFAYHLPHNLAALTVDCRGFGNGGFLHVLKHTSARMYASDRHQLDHATFIVSDFPRPQALVQHVRDVHFWILSSLTVLVDLPPDDNFLVILNRNGFYLIGRTFINDANDEFVVYRCNVEGVFVHIGFVSPD